MTEYYHYYCPICGNTVFDENTKICPGCKNLISSHRSIYNTEYYKNKSLEMYGDYRHSIQILIDEEISQNPLYNPNTKEHNAVNEYNKIIGNIFNSKQNKNENTPKCPTCGSINISKISAISKVAGAATFGLFSKTARSQFKCNNCGYKW